MIGRWWRRRRREAELDEEIAGHLAMAARDHEARGESAEEAAFAARREFGNSTLVKEITRQMWGGMWLDHVLRDLRFALRGLLRRPGHAAAAVLCFALGIGANVTMFGVLDRLFLEAPSHVRDPARVVRLLFHQGEFTGSSTNFPTYQDLAADVPALASLGAFWRTDVVVGQGVAAEKANASLVSASYLSLLGVRPRRGRLFGPEEDRSGGAHLAVLSSAYAQRRFGADSLAVGKVLDIGSASYAVIGIVPADFTGVDLEPTDVWLPLSVASPELFQSQALIGRYGYWLQTVGRLKPGSDATQAAAEATVVWRRVQPAVGHDRTSTFVTTGPIQAARGPNPSAESKVSTRLGVLSVLLLLIACANVANLLLARATARRQEIAVRLALGAGRTDMLRQAFVESLVLAVLGGAAALLVVFWAGSLVRGYVLPHGAVPGGLDGRTLAFATILALVAGLASAFLPALQASRPSVTDELKAGTPRLSARRSRAQTGLLVAQVALTLVLVVGAGLFVRSLGNVLKADLGYDTRNVLVARVDFHGSGYKSDQAYDMYRRLLDRARTIPEIQAAALTQAGPLTFGFGMSVVVPGRGLLRPKMGTYYQAVSTDYFTTLGSRLTRGRGFTPADRAGGPKVAVMGATMARLAFAGEDAVGKCVMLGSDKNCWQVVGVAEDATQWSVTESPWPMIYIPLDQSRFGAAPTALYLRARTDASTLVPLVWRALQAVDPGGPYVDVTILHKMVDPQYRPWRLGAAMLGLFGGLALLLSGLGLFGVLAYMVGQRTREIGVRVALGANRRRLFGLVLGEGLRIVAVGVVVGTLASLVLGKLVASLLFGVSPRDPWVLAASAAVLLAAAMLACMIPAGRAAMVDPMEALRYE